MSAKEAIEQGMHLHALLGQELAPEEAADMIAPHRPARAWRTGPDAATGHDRAEGDVRAGPRRLVVVEDDEAECDALKQCLEAEGYAVWAGNSGVLGLALIAEHQPDALITDLKMPVMDGAELAGAARHYARRPLAVVMISGASAAEVQSRAEACGVQHVLHKPIRVADLVSLLPTASC